MDQTAEPLIVEDLTERIAAALSKAKSRGLVEIWEAGLDDLACLRALLELRETDELDTRVRILLASGLAERDGMPARTGDALVEVVGVKFYADGWLGPRTCAMSHPFADDSGDGVLFIDATTLARRMEPFADDGWIIATHAIGDRAIEAVLDAYQHVYGDDCGPAGARIEHAQMLRPDLIERIAASGVTLCVQPGFVVSDEAEAQTALGDGWPMAYAWAAAYDAGCRLVSGSDYPIEPLNGVDSLLLLATQLGADGLARALNASTDAHAGTTVVSGELTADVPPDVVDVRTHRTT